jgi:GNAT superfamily N-acetyltransferase
MNKSTEMVAINKPWGGLSGEISESTRVDSVSSMSIHKTMHRQDKGAELYKQFEDKAKPHSDLICIEIFAHNENEIKFWKKQGFKYIGLLDQGYLEYTKSLI